MKPASGGSTGGRTVMIHAARGGQAAYHANGWADRPPGSRRLVARPVVLDAGPARFRPWLRPVLVSFRSLTRVWPLRATLEATRGNSHGRSCF